MSKPAELTDEERAAVAWRLDRYRLEAGDQTNWSALARAIELTPTAVHKARNRQAGADFAERLVRHFRSQAKGSARDLETLEAWVEASKRPGATARVVERDERYPAVDKVFRKARRMGIEDDVLDEVRENIGQLKSDTGPSEAEVELMIAEVRRDRIRLGKLWALGGRDATDLDE